MSTVSLFPGELAPAGGHDDSYPTQAEVITESREKLRATCAKTTAAMNATAKAIGLLTEAHDAFRAANVNGTIPGYEMPDMEWWETPTVRFPLGPDTTARLAAGPDQLLDLIGALDARLGALTRFHDQVQADSMILDQQEADL